MVVGINTAAAGIVSGTVTVNPASDGSGTSGLGITSLGSQNVGVSADIQSVSVFRLANPVINTPQPVAFGNVRLGARASQAPSITNTVPNDGFSESLNASAGVTSGGVTASGAFNLLTAGATNNSSVLVGINTATAGNKSGTATINFVSDGTGTSGLGQTQLLAQDVNVTGSVFRTAVASAVAPNPVNFGNVRLGTTQTQALTISNTAASDGFSERLNASFSGSSGAATTSGAGVSLLAAGASNNTGLIVGIDTSAVGNKSGTATIALQSDGAGTSGLSAIGIGTQVVNLSGTVFRLAAASTLT